MNLLHGQVMGWPAAGAASVKRRDAIVYVGARLPALSETFVFRELLGLRGRGRSILLASVRAADDTMIGTDPRLQLLAREARVVYSPAIMWRMFRAVINRPGQLARLIRDVCDPQLGGLTARAKHFVQGLAGITLGSVLANQGVGHVHAHLANTPASVALYAARTLGVPFSFTGHAADLFLYRSGLELKLREAAFVACISDWHEAFYRKVEPSLKAALPVVRCSVSIGDQPPAYGGSGILAVGRLVAKKGFDLLIEAYARQLERGGASEPLCIVGDGPERERLVLLARDLGIESSVVFAGAKPHAEVLKLIADCALFVLPCRTAASGDRDGIPVVLMEAMAAGKPVIAGDLPTIRELVQHGRSGLLIPPGDVGALTDHMQALVGDRARCAEMGREGWDRVKEEFSDDVNLNRLEAAFIQARAAWRSRNQNVNG